MKAGMTESLDTLAFSVRASPGVCAVLSGSGVSRAAGIPTGHEITLDLVRKLAAMNPGETCRDDPASWYRERYGEEPDYPNLLKRLAGTQAARQSLLRRYIEPSEEERAKGLKLPTAAHRAVAGLVHGNYVRVIITTNFDRLMEMALEEIGIIPVVLSTPEQVRGMKPLIHTRCCVFKVHGDYLDPGIRNTPAELEKYPDEFNDLLDRIFDEFGLIVCGWSAEWDEALCKAIERAKSRRFPSFWAVRGEPGQKARGLIGRRQAREIPITDADSFFSGLADRVEALEQHRPSPLSTAAAVALFKRYLINSADRIRLDDLVTAEADRVLQVFPASGPETAPDTVEPGTITIPIILGTMTEELQACEAACESLLAMAAVGGQWAEEWHYATWQNALARLVAQGEPGTRPRTRAYDGYPATECDGYPAILLFYALGLGAVTAGERGLPFIGRLFETPVPRDSFIDFNHPSHDLNIATNLYWYCRRIGFFMNIDSSMNTSSLSINPSRKTKSFRRMEMLSIVIARVHTVLRHLFPALANPAFDINFIKFEKIVTLNSNNLFRKKYGLIFMLGPGQTFENHRDLESYRNVRNHILAKWRADLEKKR